MESANGERRVCAECKANAVEVTKRNGRDYESLWCASCKAKLIEATRGARFVQSDADESVEVAPFILSSERPK